MVSLIQSYYDLLRSVVYDFNYYQKSRLYESLLFYAYNYNIYIIDIAILIPS